MSKMRNFKKETIEKVIGAMKDTDDPKEGSVFEKTVDVDFATFCAFVLTQWDNVTMETAVEDKAVCYLFYNGPKGTDHVASYIVKVLGYAVETYGQGVFGGSRVGSENKRWNDTGVAYVKDAFEVRDEK